MAYEKGKRTWLHRGRGADNAGQSGNAKAKKAKTGMVKVTAPKGQTTRQPQKEQETKRLVPFLESFGDEPVMVTVTFGEGLDAGR